MASFFSNVVGGGDEKPAAGAGAIGASFASGGTIAPVVDDTEAATFWAAEKAWQRGELERGFLVAIGDPQTVSGTFTSYTTYLIKSSICVDGVRRRYSDFEWLRDVLVSRYHGLCVPLMPEKRAIGNQSAKFIEERMGGLESFMTLCLASPYLRNDVTLTTFLTLKGAPEFEQAKKATQQGSGADPATNTGLARWFGVLRHLPLPADADAACREVAAYCAEMEAKLVGALAAVTKYHDAARGLVDAFKAVRDSLTDLSASAAVTAAALSDTLAPVRASTLELRTKAKSAADAFAAAHDLAVFSPNEISIFLLDGLVAELHRIRSLRTLVVDVRGAAQAEYSAAWTAQDKAKFQQAQLREKGQAPKADAMEPKVAEAVALSRRMKERLDDISKGILHIEADKGARIRVARLIAMTGQFAALSMASGVRAQELWTGFLAAMSLDQAAMVADAQRTLVGAVSLHSFDAVGAGVTYTAPSTVLDASTPAIAVNSAAGAAAGGAAAGAGDFGGGGASASAGPAIVPTSFTAGATGFGAGGVMSSSAAAGSGGGGGGGAVATDL